MKLVVAVTSYLALTVLCSSAHAQASAADRLVQIRSVDLATSTVELFNFGMTDIPMAGWRFCSHDNVDAFDYTSLNGLNPFTIEAGTSFFVHWDNDAAPDADNVNVSTLGGFAADINFDAFSVAIYANSSFATPASMIDTIQWSLGGMEDLLADARTGVAQNAGLWVNETNNDDEWINISGTTADLITLDDATGGLLHGPADYTVTSPPLFTADFDGDDDVDGNDLTDPVDGWLARYGVDLNGSNFLDWQRQFGSGTLSSSTVPAIPEPSTAFLLVGIAALGLCARRR